MRATLAVVVSLILLVCGSASAEPASYTYDAAGRLTSEWVGSVRVEYSYDPSGNLLTQASCMADCYIGGECFLEGNRNPVDNCLACESTAVRTDWTEVPCGEDMGGSADMGSPTDMGTTTSDMGLEPGSDTGTSSGDSGTSGGDTGGGGGTDPNADDGGCNCSVGAGSKPNIFPFLLLGGFWVGRRRRRRARDGARLGAVVLLLVVLAPATASAVRVCQACQYKTIAEGIANTSDGGTVTVEAGTYNESGLQLFSKSLKAETPSAIPNVIIDGGQNDRVFQVAFANIEGVMIQNGRCIIGPGGGLETRGGQVFLKNVVIKNNDCDYGGGGIGSNTGTELTITNSEIRDNTAKGGGGGIGGAFGALILVDTKVQDNTVNPPMIGVTAIGGGISVGFGTDYMELRNSNIDRNQVLGVAGSSGGGIWTTARVGKVIGGTVSDNILSGVSTGGGIFVDTGTPTATILEDVTISGNSAVQGGGVYLASGPGSLRVYGGTISGNAGAGAGDGGGFYCAMGVLEFSASVTGNVVDEVAGICVNCTAGATQACTTAIPGACAAGMQTCGGLGIWGACVSTTMSSVTEMMCMDSADNDCDGKVDAADPDCRPKRPATRADVGGSGEKGDPVNTFTGEFYTHPPSDLDLGGPKSLFFRRYYSSGLEALGRSGTVGANWRHNFEWDVIDGGTSVTVIDPKGRMIEFADNNGEWELSDSTDVSFTLVTRPNGFLFYDPRDDQFVRFDGGLATVTADGQQNLQQLTYVAGELTQVSDPFGRVLSFTYDGGGLLDSVTDGTRTVSFVHAGSDLTEVVDVLSNSTTYTYSAGSRLTSITLPEGNVPVSQTYDASGRVTSQTEGGTDTSTFAYNDAAGTCTITDPDNGVAIHTHDIRGRLLQVQKPSGSAFDLGYDADGRRSSASDTGGATTQTSYNIGSEHPTSTTLADGTTITYDMVPRYTRFQLYDDVGAIHYPDGTSERMTYDGAGNLISMTDRAGGVASFTHNEFGQTLSATNQAGGVTSYAYDANALLTTETDNAGNTISYTYDALGRQTSVNYADSASRTTVYDDANRITSTTDERGNVVSYAYDSNGNLTSSTDGEGNVTTVAWDGQDRFLSYTDPLGATASVSYDALGRIDGQTNRTGGVTTLEYDLDGRVTAMVDASGERWERTYQANGWLASLSDPLGNAIEFERDAAGSVTVVRSPLGHETRFVNDALGRTTMVTDPLNGLTTYLYDERGFVAEITLPGNISATYQRNALGQVTIVTDQAGSAWLFDYDAAGRLLSRTDPVGNQITRTFDSHNRPAAWVLPGGLGTVSTTYDGMDNVTAQDYSGGPNLAFTYDRRNLLTAADGLTIGYDENGMVKSSNGIALVRDAGGRVQTVSYPGGNVTYTYDVGGNLAQVDDWLGNSITFEYDAAGRRTQVVRPNGVNTTVGYDADNNVTSIDEAAGATVLAGIALERDALGNTISATRDVPSLPALPGDSGFGYDAAGQVDSFAYDALGRLTTDDQRSYTWDGASRLTSYAEGGNAVTFTHDGLLLVTGRSEGGTTEDYIWNHGLRRPAISIVRRDGSDHRYYVHTREGELLYSIDAVTNDVRHYHFDEVGNTLFLTDDTGVVTDSYGYTAYGELTSSSGTTENPFAFGGRYGVMQQGSTGLYLMGRRFYDSRTKRFISREPVVEMLHPKLINPYTYAVGNPLRYIDPTGEANEDASKPAPVPDAVKNTLKVNKAGTALVAKNAERLLEQSADGIAAANGFNRANAADRLLGRAAKNPEWVDAGLNYSKKLEKVQSVAGDIGKVGKIVKFGVDIQEDGGRAIVEFGAEEIADKLGGKFAGAAAGIIVETIKMNEKVGEVQSQLKKDSLSNVESYYRAVDNNMEAYRAKLITEEELVRRIKAAREVFEETNRGTQDAGVAGILEEVAKGAEALLWNLVGL